MVDAEQRSRALLDHGDTDTESLVRRRLTESIQCHQRTLSSDCVEQAATVARHIVASIRNGGQVLFFGNGGSSMDAGHLAAELMGRFYRERAPLPAVSLSDATAVVTAIGNDYAYEEIFARQVRGLGRAGDVAIGLTTSGNSANVVRALSVARERGLFAVALTGATGGRVREVVDICVQVPADDTPRVQEVCMNLGHIICEIVEAELAAAAVS